MDHWKKYHDTQNRDELMHSLLSIVFYLFIASVAAWISWEILTDAAAEYRHTIRIIDGFTE